MKTSTFASSTSRAGCALRFGAVRVAPPRLLQQHQSRHARSNRVDVNAAIHPAAAAAQVQREMEWFRVPPKVYFKGGALEVALGDLAGKTRAFIVTDKNMFDLDYVDKVTRVLDMLGVQHQLYYHVEPDPTIEAVHRGLADLNDFRPDTIIAIGGGSPMDAAKLMWLMYEIPDCSLEKLVTRTMDMRSDDIAGPPLGRKATMITIPTTSGTGAEVTPFAVLSDGQGNKFTVASHNLTPRMAIVDPQLVLSLPPDLTAQGGIHALSHAIESLTSTFCSVYTRGLSKQAASLIHTFLPRAYTAGANDYLAREKMHYAACIAGMAFSNTMLGLGHSAASAIAAQYGVPQGLAIAPLLPAVILYNAAGSEQAAEDYEELADTLRLPKHPKGSAHAVAEAIRALVQQVGLPTGLKGVVGEAHEEQFRAAVPALAKTASEDLHTGANARPVSVQDVERMLLECW